MVVYVRPEDEFFHKQASASFTFPIEGRAVGKDELQPLRLVLLLPANKVAAARYVWGSAGYSIVEHILIACVLVCVGWGLGTALGVMSS